LARNGAPVAWHPHVDLVAATSRQFGGKTLAEIFPRFTHDEKANALSSVMADPKAAGPRRGDNFLALPHGLAAEFANRSCQPARA